MTNREIEKEIIDNIAQHLCLVRLSLGSVDINNQEKAAELLREASLLIGKTVTDLRNLVRKINEPDTTAG